MSHRIDTILDLLGEVKTTTSGNASQDIVRQHRISATKRIAKQRQCDERSVRDTYRDQLQPEVYGVDQFDSLLDAWLNEGNGRLKAILLKHGDTHDKQRIEHFFREGLAFPKPEQETIAEAAALPDDSALPDEFMSNFGFPEGALKRVYVNAYERNPAARRACIAHHGPICSVCGFIFGIVYGALAEGFIHVHHLKPLAEIGERYEVDPIVDLRPVCANCHAIIHLGGGCLSIDEARQHVDSRVLLFWSLLAGNRDSVPKPR